MSIDDKEDHFNSKRRYGVRSSGTLRDPARYRFMHNDHSGIDHRFGRQPFYFAKTSKINVHKHSLNQHIEDLKNDPDSNTTIVETQDTIYGVTRRRDTRKVTRGGKTVTYDNAFRRDSNAVIEKMEKVANAAPPGKQNKTVSRKALKAHAQRVMEAQKTIQLHKDFKGCDAMLTDLSENVIVVDHPADPKEFSRVQTGWGGNHKRNGREMRKQRPKTVTKIVQSEMI